jgi:hypothetical protein
MGVLVLAIATAPIAGGGSASVVGRCGFDPDRLAFAGSAPEQAACLLRHVWPGGGLDSAPATLPADLAARIGGPVDIDRERLIHYLEARPAVAALARRLDEPVSRGGDNARESPKARYFVIHDTSQPYFAGAPFPADMDTSDAVNDLSGYLGPNAVAHLFINRRGVVVVGHDFSEPWRATKFESRVIGLPAKGLFLHVESQQPRRTDPTGPPGNDRIAPVPGLTTAQYDALALAYIVASVRAGAWLIPAFHAAIDEGLTDAHDDPQNFDLATFDGAVTRQLAQCQDAFQGSGKANTRHGQSRSNLGAVRNGSRSQNNAAAFWSAM